MRQGRRVCIDGRNTDESRVNLAGFHSQRWQQRDIGRNSRFRNVLMSHAAGRRCSHRTVWLSLALYATNPHIVGMCISTEVHHIIPGQRVQRGESGGCWEQLCKPWKWKQWHNNSIWSKRMNESVDKHINKRVKGVKSHMRKKSSRAVMNEWNLIYYSSNH